MSDLMRPLTSISLSHLVYPQRDSPMRSTNVAEHTNSVVLSKASALVRFGFKL